MTKIIKAYNDGIDAENPTEWRGWRLVSFGRRHVNYQHPYDIGLGDLDDGGPRIEDIGLRRRLDTGTAFLLSYYEHGACKWSLQGGGPQCRWDSVGFAGVLFLDGEADERVRDEETGRLRRRTYEERREHAAYMLGLYTDWCNGWVYYLVIDEDTDEEDSLGMVYGTDLDCVAEELAGTDDYEIEYVYH